MTKNYLRLSIRLNPKTFCFSFFIFSFSVLLMFFDLELLAFGFKFSGFYILVLSLSISSVEFRVFICNKTQLWLGFANPDSQTNKLYTAHTLHFILYIVHYVP